MPNGPGIVIGLDCGTQSAKACAWDLDGRPIRSARSPLTVSSPREGWAEQPPDLWWRSACSALRAVAAGLDRSRVAALGLAFQRESFALLDASGTPCRPAILWLDMRASSEVDPLESLLGAGACHRATGKPLDATCALPRLRWLLRCEPEVMARAKRWTDVGSYVIERLTGRFATVRAGADTCGLVDLATGGWRRDWLQALDVDYLSLPELIDAGSLAGTLLPEAAGETGLPAGLPVIGAGGDGQVLRPGLGCPGSSGWSLTLGTGIVLGAGSASPEVSPAWRTLFAADPRGGYVRESVLQSGTWALGWLRDAVGPAASAVSTTGPGSDGLLALPHLWGMRFPSSVPEARAAFVGLSSRHGPAHFHRALLEGIAFELRRMAEAMAPATAEPILATGGGTKNREWLSIIASVLGRPVALPHEPESAALGAAMLAAGALGRSMAAGRTVEIPPDPALRSAYAEIYARQWLPTLELALRLSARP